MTSKRIAAYRGRLIPVQMTATQLLSRSERNGNYYLASNGQEAEMIGMIDAAKWLTTNGFPQEADTKVYAK